MGAASRIPSDSSELYAFARISVRTYCLFFALPTQCGLLSQKQHIFLTSSQAATYESFRDRLHALYRKDQFEIHEDVLAFHDRLKCKYPNARDFLLFHLISGSTFREFDGSFDFPGSDSVEHFITQKYLETFSESFRALLSPGALSIISSRIDPMHLGGQQRSDKGNETSPSLAKDGQSAAF